MKDKLIHELEFCVDLWEKQGYCEFGEHTNCKECATPYLLLKLITGEVLHGKMERLSLQDWKEKIKKINKHKSDS